MENTVQIIDTFVGDDGDHYAKVIDPENGKELIRTSEGYEHPEDALHAINKSVSLVIASNRAG